MGPGGGRGGTRRWVERCDTLHCYPMNCGVNEPQPLSLTRVNWSLCVCPSRKEMMVLWYLLEMFKNVSPKSDLAVESDGGMWPIIRTCQ